MSKSEYTLVVGRGRVRHIPARHDPEVPVCKVGTEFRGRAWPDDMPLDHLPECRMCKAARSRTYRPHPALP